MSEVYISGTEKNVDLIKQVADKLIERHHSICGNALWDNPEKTLSNIINADIAIFIMAKRDNRFLTREVTQNVLVELGIAVGSGKLTIVVGKAEGARIINHPWVRRMGLQELLDYISSNRHLDYIPPTQVNAVEEKERTDREEKL